MCVACGCRPFARSKAYEILSVGFLYPDPPVAEFLTRCLPEVLACLQHLGDEESAGRLQELVAWAWDASALQREYEQVFGHGISQECPPYESEYDQAHIFQKSQTLADIAGFYQAFGLQLAPSCKDRLDHISVELEFLHFLTLKEAHASARGHPEDNVALCREAQRKFLDEHLGQWAFTFVRKLKEKAGTGRYGLWGELTGSFLAAELARLALKERGQVAALVPQVSPDEEEAACLSCPLVEAIGGGVP